MGGALGDAAAADDGRVGEREELGEGMLQGVIEDAASGLHQGLRQRQEAVWETASRQVRRYSRRPSGQTAREAVVR